MTNSRFPFDDPKRRSIQTLVILLSIVSYIACSSPPDLPSTSTTRQVTETLADDIDEGRKLSEYEYGEKQTCLSYLNGKRHDQFSGEEKVRDFILDHWNEKRRGYISYSCSGIDTTNTSYFFVEPKVGDSWNVVEKSLYTNVSTKDRKVTSAVFVDVKRVDSVGDQAAFYVELIGTNGETTSIPFRRR